MTESDKEARLGMRRLTPEDAARAAALYRAAGRDSGWMSECGAAAACTDGAMYGGFSGDGRMTLCGGLCRRKDFPALYAAVRKTRLASGDDAVLLPPAGRVLAPFLQLLLARASEAGGQVWLPVPVKTGGGALPACFAAGFSLRAIRPLDELRPHYLFTCSDGPMKSARECDIMIPVSDTLTLSRLLECGMRGEGVCVAGGVPSVCLLPK